MPQRTCSTYLSFPPRAAREPLSAQGARNRAPSAVQRWLRIFRHTHSRPACLNPVEVLHVLCPLSNTTPARTATLKKSGAHSVLSVVVVHRIPRHACPEFNPGCCEVGGCHEGPSCTRSECVRTGRYFHRQCGFGRYFPPPIWVCAKARPQEKMTSTPETVDSASALTLLAHQCYS